MERVDEYALGINTQLAKKYNAIVNFINKKTIYEDGCINVLIESVKYIREDIKGQIFKTNDYIQIKESTFNHVIYINNPKSLKIDRKYNAIVRV